MKKKNTALELSGEQFVTKDPVFRFLRDKLGVRLTIFLTGLFAALIFLSDVLRSEPDQRWVEILTSIRKLLVLLFGLWVYFVLPGWIADLFNGLQRNRVIQSRSGSYGYDDFQHEVVRTINRPIVSVLGFAFVLIYWVRRVFTFSHSRSIWVEAAALIFVYAIPYYAFMVSLLRLCFTLLSTKRLFKLFDVKVNPLHVDGVGGFKPIGRILLRYTIVLVVFVSLATAGRVLSYQGNQFKIIILGRSEVYMAALACILFPLFVWGWLWVPHEAMMKYRDSKLEELDEELQSADPEKEIERLSALRKRYKLTQISYPTWPMSFGQIRKFFSLIIVPVITTLLTLGIQALWAQITRK